MVFQCATESTTKSSIWHLWINRNNRHKCVKWASYALVIWCDYRTENLSTNVRLDLSTLFFCSWALFPQILVIHISGSLLNKLGFTLVRICVRFVSTSITVSVSSCITASVFRVHAVFNVEMVVNIMVNYLENKHDQLQGKQSAKGINITMYVTPLKLVSNEVCF